MVGKTLSHYKILEELGRGGMGIVYKGEDTKLHRTVAIKVLPAAALSSDDDRARFYREARAAASLSHPNIATVYEIDEAVPEGSKDDDLRPSIAMEFIEGDTLEDRIKQGPMKLTEAVRIASEMAEGLKAAHAKDIVHRDVKTANVMLDADGRAKILDFGLAQTAQSTKLTRMGSTLGTVAYMSPEQARGEEVDTRTDIWALGVTLYEMIAGTHPFGGDYEQAVVYSILNQDPEPLTAVRTGVPMGLEWIISKCVAKQAKDRYQNCNDLLVNLRNVDLMQSGMSRKSASSAIALPVNAPKHLVEMTRTTLLMVGAIAALFVVVLVYFMNPGGDSTGGRDIVHSSMVLSPAEPLALIGTAPAFLGRRALALSPDGRLFAYAAELALGETQLAVREMDGYETTLIPDTEGAYLPFFSPDGSQLGFFANDQLKVVSLSGGASSVLVDVRNVQGGVWTARHGIIYSDNEGHILRKISIQDGEPQNIGNSDFIHPAILPDGDHLLGVSANGELQVISVVSGLTTSLEIGVNHNQVSSPSYVSSGHLIFMQNAKLTAIPFDPRNLEVQGTAVPVIEDIRNESLDYGGHYAVSDNGTLIYAQGGNVRVGHLVQATGQDEYERLPFESKIFGEMRISPDGSKLAICVLGARWDIWIYDLKALGDPRRLTVEGNNYNPVWTPDGREIIFSSERGGDRNIYAMSATSSGDVTQLTSNSISQRPSSISHDGKWLLLNQTNPDTGGDIMALSLDGDSVIATTGASVHREWGATFSPDGKSFAYMSDEPGAYEVYMKEFSDADKHIQLSTAHGLDPIWSKDGKFIYYNNVREIYRVSVDPEDNYSHEEPVLLFDGLFVDLGGKGWAFDEDGDRFILVQTIEMETIARQLNVVTNWFEELNKLAPPAN